ncbi:hypothetical protein EMPS_10275 [Entomortierella parvispora]|uniref:Translin n=1 Tax=Entomortierella parvispora TaxID=205924 RepID=A0A9P3HJS5_9FUNG|nr:hypothetical protein EMPS_10275 [Entomortierella parvispora]
MDLSDVHMETPPASSASASDPLLSALAHEDTPKTESVRAKLGQSVVKDFALYRDILEQHHEKRERIIKISRDINNFSKKMIFALHRAEPKDFLPQFAPFSEALVEFKEKHATVLKLFHRVAIDLQDSNYYRYQRSISGAMQEYIEALTLEYYLTHGALMPKSALEKDLVFMTTPEQMSNPDLIISIAETSSFGGGGGRGRGGRGGSRGRGGGLGGGDDIRRGPYTRDSKEEANQKVPQPPTEPKTEGTTESETSASPSPMVVDTDQSTAAAVATAVLVVASNLEALQTRPPAPSTRVSLEVTDEDYLLGIADLTGELMRLAINTLGQSIIAVPQDPSASTAALPTPEVRVQQILNFLRDIKSGFDGLSLTRASPISKKMGVLKQSLNKIELACYNVKVRGAEYPPEILRQLLMSGQDIGGGSGGQNGSEIGNEDDE